MKSALGCNHPDTLQTMNNLANNYSRQEKHEDAEELYRDCLDRRRMMLGEEHPDTIRCMVDYAQSLENRGFNNKARELHNELSQLLCKDFFCPLTSSNHSGSSWESEEGMSATDDVTASVAGDVGEAVDSKNGSSSEDKSGRVDQRTSSFTIMKGKK
jgi:hypothetical protein